MALGFSPAVAAAGWGRTIRLDGPQTRDILPAQIAFSDAGEAAVAFGVQDADNPASSAAFVALRSAHGGIRRARRIGQARQPLGVGFLGSRLVLLTGNAPRRRVCCASARVTVAAGRRDPFERATLTSSLTGDTSGALLPLASGELMSAVATQRGVWTAQSTARGRLTAATRLASDGAPQNLAAAPLAGGGAAIAWSTALGSGETFPRRIEVAFGTATRAPRDPHIVVTVPPGHSVDEVALAAGSVAPTVAWVESWFDGGGGFHSRVETARAVRGAHGAPVSPSGQRASQLSLATGPTGRQVIAWEGCDSLGVCVTAAAARRRSTTPFGRVQRLGGADGGEGTAAAVSPTGLALVGWIDGGNVLVAGRGEHANRFARAHAISRTGLDSDLALAFGPRGGALAAWTQGTLAPSVFARAYGAG
jgi:hypothetical protein